MASIVILLRSFIVMMAAMFVTGKDVELRLGGSIALTGSKKASGLACKQGLDLWASRLNELGGIKLSNGDRVKVRMPLALVDDESVKSKSKDLLANMLDPSHADYADLHFVIGPFSSGFTLGNADVALSRKKILLSHGASESIYNKGNGYVFSTLTPGKGYMTSGLTVLHGKGARSVVFMHEEKSFSTSVCSGGNMTAHLLGMQVLGYFAYKPGTQNFAEYIFTVKSLNPDVMVGCGHKSDINYLVGQAVLMGVEPKAILITHSSSMDVVESVGGRSHALLGPTQWDKSLDFRDDDGFFGSALEYDERFSATYGKAPSYVSAYASANGYLLQKAIELADSIETEKVRAALYKLSVNSFYGPLDLSGDSTVSPLNPDGLLGVMPKRPMVTTQIQMGSIGTVAPLSAANLELIYPAPSWSEKLLLNHPCALGQEETPGGCENCSAGAFRDATVLVCTPCPPGTSAAASGSSSCSPCPRGKVSRKRGSTTCEGCSPGTFASEVGMSLCLNCRAGSFANGTGAEECENCAQGRYQELKGKSFCVPCSQDGVFTTRFLGASSAGECICPVGMYRSSGSSPTCLDCPEGMSCAIGSDLQNYWNWHEKDRRSQPGEFPRLLPSYMALPSAPLAVYLCSSKGRCPGGVPGTCGNGHFEESWADARLACGDCAPGSRLRDGSCMPCEAGSVWLPIILAAASIIFVCVGYNFVTTDYQLIVSNKIALTSAFSLLAAAVQMLGVFRIVSVPWPSSTAAMIDVLSLVTLDLEEVNIGCLFASSLQKYLASVVLVYGFLLTIFLCHCITRLLPCSKFRWSVARTFNLLGTVLQALFVTAATVALAPMMCYTHPTGDTSVQSFPSILCGHHDHYVMLVFAVILVVMLLGFYTYLVVLCYTAPLQSQKNGELFYQKIAFFFARFRQDRYWWGCVWLLRSLLLAVLPVLYPDDPYAQILMLVATLIIFVCMQATFSPWRLPLFNALEVLMCSLLILMLVSTSSLLRPVSNSSAEPAYSALMIAFVLSVLISSVVVMLGTGLSRLQSGAHKPASGWLYFRQVRRETYTEEAEAWKSLASLFADVGLQAFGSFLCQLDWYDHEHLAQALGIFLVCFQKQSSFQGRLCKRIIARDQCKIDAQLTNTQPAHTMECNETSEAEMAEKTKEAAEVSSVQAVQDFGVPEEDSLPARISAFRKNDL